MPQQHNSETIADDVLKGAGEIAAFVGETEAAIRHKIRIGAIPVKYVGASIRGSKSVLRSVYGSPGATA